MAHEVRLHPRVERYLGPVGLAQFIDLGWIVQPPMALTSGGRRAFKNGYGFWDGTNQQLPIHCELIQMPFDNPPIPKWDGRIVRLGRQTAEQE